MYARERERYINNNKWLLLYIYIRAYKSASYEKKCKKNKKKYKKPVLFENIDVFINRKAKENNYDT